MNGGHISEILLQLSVLLVLSYLLAGALARVRVPAILTALFVAMAVQHLPFAERLVGAELVSALDLLAGIGVLFLLFTIGLQIDVGAMRRLGGDIAWCTLLNTSVPFLLGVLAMLALGYGWIMAFIIGLTQMPTAEAVVVPILDEFQLIRTRAGQMIIGAGTLDDLIEVFLVCMVSIWIGEKAGAGAQGIESTRIGIGVSLVAFTLLAWVCHRWLVTRFATWLPRRPRNLILLSVAIVFGFGALSELAGLGMLLGAIAAGVLMRPAIDDAGPVGEQTLETLEAVTYGFLGPLFFLWIGLAVDVSGLFRAPLLAILLYLAGTVGKLVGVFLMVPMKKLDVREAWTVGIGLNARLTTEIIVAKLLLDAGLIDAELFTALVSAASFTAISVPVALSLLLRRWGDALRTPARRSESPTSARA